MDLDEMLRFDLDQINQYFADIATDPKYDPDQITSIKPTTSYKNSKSRIQNSKIP